MSSNNVPTGPYPGQPVAPSDGSVPQGLCKKMLSLFLGNITILLKVLNPFHSSLTKVLMYPKAIFQQANCQDNQYHQVCVMKTSR